MSSMDKRRQEIETKRAKLAELRKARSDRQRADAERRTSDVCSPLSHQILVYIIKYLF